MKKSQARKEFLALRSKLSEDEVDSLSLILLENLKKLPIWDKTFYHIFLPIGGKKEVNTYPIIDYLWEKEKKVCIPKIDFLTNTMDCLIFEKGNPLNPNKYGIYEPLHNKKINSKSLEVIFVPLLAFDLSGHRVGYGKGFYDRFLGICKKNILKIGLSFFEPVDKIEDVDEKDTSLDRVITPRKN